MHFRHCGRGRGRARGATAGLIERHRAIMKRIGFVGIHGVSRLTLPRSLRRLADIYYFIDNDYQKAKEIIVS